LSIFILDEKLNLSNIKITMRADKRIENKEKAGKSIIKSPDDYKNTNTT
jgi:hypothetical protein